MRIPVYFRQCGSEQEVMLFSFKMANDPGVDYEHDVVVWREHGLIGLVGDNVDSVYIAKVNPRDFPDKVVFYDRKEPDYELKAWSDRVRLFARLKADVVRMTFDEVAKEYFERRGISNWQEAMADRVDTPGWNIPRFFADRGILGFECLYDLECYIRKVVVSERIFDALDVKEKLFCKK